jgi:hypothetical protein
MEQPTPVIIVSSCVRAGTTLAQRLLCSAPNALVYGDSVGQEMEFFAKYAAVKEQMLAFHAFSAASMRTAVLAGDTSDFITALAPPAAALVAGWRAAALAWLQTCVDDAQAAGRPVWGWKMAGADAQALAGLAAWFPEARWILVRRDLADCFRSAKAAGMVSGPRDAANFAHAAWATAKAFETLAPRALALDYALMTQDPAGAVAALEAFTGARGIQADVFKTRVNQVGQAHATPPASLAPEEELALQGGASEIPSRLIA